MNVFTAGCFDILHSGHFNLLLFCRQIAGTHGKVHVSIDTDEKIKAEKGEHRPILDAAIRFSQLHELQFDGRRLIDYIHNHESNEALDMRIRSMTDLIKKDTVIVVGEDYKGKDVVGSDLLPVIYFPKSRMSTSFIEAAVLDKRGLLK
jgi:D-beta-D-heptose 7-phosphate kinase/D-beta-D-heptose 1-phosphate adenosyltransferase